VGCRRPSKVVEAQIRRRHVYLASDEPDGVVRPELLLREITKECGWTAKVGPIQVAWQYLRSHIGTILTRPA